MADTDQVQSIALAGPSRSSSSRADMEGLGKFKVRQYPRSSAPPPKSSSSYKSKFFVLKEAYDTVAARHEELLRELQIANSKLKSVQAENDLLLDAMQIVTPSQPALVTILQQMDPEPLSASADMYPPHRGSYIPAPPPSVLPEQIHTEMLVEAPPLPPLNGNNGNGSELSHGHGPRHGHTHAHSHHQSTNGRTRRTSRDYRESMNNESADQEMIDVDRELVDRDRDRE